MGFPKKVTFIHPGGRVHTETFSTFATANGTDRRGAKRILELWQEKRWIVRQPDGSFAVLSKRSRRDPWTMDQLRAEGLPAPKPKINGVRADRVIMDEVPEFMAGVADAEG